MRVDLDFDLEGEIDKWVEYSFSTIWIPGLYCTVVVMMLPFTGAKHMVITNCM